MPNHAVLPAAPQADEVARVTAERDRLHANVQSVHEVSAQGYAPLARQRPAAAAQRRSGHSGRAH